MRATALVHTPNGAGPTGTVARLSNGRGILVPWNADVPSVSNRRLLFIRQQCLSAGVGLREWAYNLQASCRRPSCPESFIEICRTMRQGGRSMPDPSDSRVTMADPDLWVGPAGGWPSKQIPAHGGE
jgi:hypothetical protein